MKKQLITLSILAAFAGMAHAQTNVTIYGIIDTGYAKETGSDWQMSFWDYNRLGFKGTEDLGGGMKATFQIEKRFDPGKGSTLGNDFDGASNVGLAGNWGAIRLGRINSLEVENFRRFDPFNEQGVSSTLLSTLNFNRLSNMARYDSPVWGGFSFSASYALGQNTDKATYKGTSQPGTSGGGLAGGVTDANYATTLKNNGLDNDGYALSLNYNNGPLLLNANYELIPDSDKGYIWSLAGKYKIDNFSIGLGYQHTTNKGYRPQVTGSTFSKNQLGVKSKQDNVFLAAEYETGPHKFAGILNWMRVSDIDLANNGVAGAGQFSNYGDGDVKKIGLGYWYSLSKRTSLYGQVAYTKYEDATLAQFFRGTDFDTDKVTGIQFGINHKF